MLTVETMIAIALWCSTSTNIYPGRTLEQIQGCRNRMLLCMTYPTKDKDCFKAEDLTK